MLIGQYVAAPVKTHHHLPRQAQEMLPVRVDCVDPLTTIPARSHVAQRTGEFQSSRSGDPVNPLA